MSDEIEYTGDNDDEVLEIVRTWFPEAEVKWSELPNGTKALSINDNEVPMAPGTTIWPSATDEAILVNRPPRDL